MPRLLLALAAAVPLAGLTALAPAAGAQPLGDVGGAYGVTSPDAVLTVVSPPTGDLAYLATYEPGVRVTLQSPVSTRSRWPVRLVEVVPQGSLPPCGWLPEQVELVDGLTGDRQPFAPVALARDEVVQLRITGAFGCSSRDARFDGLATVESLTVRYEVLGGPTREGTVELGYSFGWGDDPASFLEGLVREQLPS